MSKGLKESINNPPTKYYKKIEEKPYHRWLNEHKDEILNQPVKTRAQYAFEKINADLQLNLKYEAVYQLLYRAKMLIKEPEAAKPNPNYYLRQLIEQLTEINSVKKTKKCIDKLMKLYAKQASASATQTSN